MGKSKDKGAVLGILVNTQSVVGVLLRPNETHIEIIDRFSRSRVMQVEMAGVGTSLPGLHGSEDADFSMQVGGDGSGNMDLGAFSGIDEIGLQSVGQDSGDLGAKLPPTVFTKQLKEILAECRTLGYDNPPIAFCIAPPDISYTEIQLESEGQGMSLSGQGVGRITQAERKLLRKKAEELHSGVIDPERIDFLPMAPRDNRPYYLGLVPAGNEPVSPTLEALRRDKMSVPAAPLIDTELSIFTSLIGLSEIGVDQQYTALIRVGTEDTLILFFHGPHLMHFEMLSSITIYDVPEKVCSRVMLQQDEQMISKLDHVLVSSDGPMDQLIESFKSFYPQANVESVASLLGAHQVELAGQELGELKAGPLVALGVALRVIGKWENDPRSITVNLMPKKLRKRKRVISFTGWHTVAMLAIVFGVTFFYVTRYLQNEFEIEQRRQDLLFNPPVPVLEDPVVLQARIDSLRQAHSQYTHGLQVLDSLLLGSDRWSRFIEKLTRATGERSGLWLDRWEVQPGSVRLFGTALSRNRVVQFARTMDGTIEKADSYDIEDEFKDLRAYEFVMKVPVAEEMPRVALHLQQQAAVDDELETRTQVQAEPTPVKPVAGTTPAENQ